MGWKCVGLLQHENEEDPSEGGVRSMHSGSTGGIIKIFTIVNDTIKSLLSAENDEEKVGDLAFIIYLHSMLSLILWPICSYCARRNKN